MSTGADLSSGTPAKFVNRSGEIGAIVKLMTAFLLILFLIWNIEAIFPEVFRILHLGLLFDTFAESAGVLVLSTLISSRIRSFVFNNLRMLVVLTVAFVLGLVWIHSGTKEIPGNSNAISATTPENLLSGELRLTAEVQNLPAPSLGSVSFTVKPDTPSAMPSTVRSDAAASLRDPAQGIDQLRNENVPPLVVKTALHPAIGGTLGGQEFAEGASKFQREIPRSTTQNVIVPDTYIRDSKCTTVTNPRTLVDFGYRYLGYRNVPGFEHDDYRALGCFLRAAAIGSWIGKLQSGFILLDVIGVPGTQPEGIRILREVAAYSTDLASRDAARERLAILHIAVGPDNLRRKQG
jgi:hypothetical protein